MLNTGFFNDPESINSLLSVSTRNDESTTFVKLSHIPLTYKNSDHLAISTSQNGSDGQEATNLLNQAKVCHSELIEKVTSGKSQ